MCGNNNNNNNCMRIHSSSANQVKSSPYTSLGVVRMFVACAVVAGTTLRTFDPGGILVAQHGTALAVTRGEHAVP